MSRLNPIEEECKDLCSVLLDFMGSGKRQIGHTEHMELMGRVRDVHRRLINKEFGCETGRHAGVCHCTKETV